MTELRTSYARKGIAFLNDDACGRAEASSYRGQKNMGACHNVVGVNDSRIGSEQVVPTEAVAKSFLGEFPEGIAGLHG